jgi:hypothetical protein
VVAASQSPISTVAKRWNLWLAAAGLVLRPILSISVQFFLVSGERKSSKRSYHPPIRRFKKETR